MKLHFFGTCSGTEPLPERRHVAFALEMENGIYWFDAGESSAYTAHLMGLDLLRVRSIFISHCHMDHVGGLGNLLWYIRKCGKVSGRLPLAEEVQVYLPRMETYEGMMMLLQGTEQNFTCPYRHGGYPVQDGFSYQSPVDDLTVTAHHNHHLPHEEGEPWRSFSYRICAEGKEIVFSGDIALEDLSTLLDRPCDLLLVETGHHTVEDICGLLQREQKQVGALFFIHNGRDILKDPLDAALRAQRLFDGPVHICEDATTYNF